MLLPQCGDGAFPAELWLGISRDAVSVYKRGEAWPLEVFPYEQILSFGAPLPNAYKIVVEGRELLFETQMVGSSRREDFGRNRAQIKVTVVLVPPAGHGRRQADEGLHQHDRQEALQQLSVHQQPRQRLVSPAPSTRAPPPPPETQEER